jgi:Zn-dependent protease with chaperone function
MDRFPARYFDGHSSAVHDVEVRVEGGNVLIFGDTVLLTARLDELRFRPRLGRLPVSIELPDGALLQGDAGAVGAVLELPPASGFAQRLESHLGAVVASLAGLAVAGWFGYHDGVPWLAREVAFRLPASMEQEIADEGLKGLDRAVFKPSKVADDRRKRLREVFAALAKEGGVSARLEFRDGNWVGANALALPGGVVVITDQLVELFEDDERIAAVLAHEVGHLHYRHGARAILQDSLVALGTMALLGDASSVASIATTLPTVMLHTSYSRDFERESDQFAFALLKKTGRSPKLFAEALAAMEAARDKQASGGSGEGCKVPEDDKVESAEKTDTEEKDKKKDRRWTNLGYLSTHPATHERIKAAEEAAR